MNSPAVFYRPMQVSDIERVMEVDRLSFSMPWPKSSFRFELEDNDASKCWVAETSSPDGSLMLIGMAVVWLVVDQAHVATFAVHPSFRGLGIGKKFLSFILYKAHKEGMLSATLEVRETNEIAQSLYRDLGFKVTGRRLRYYHDTMEDALIMTLPFPIQTKIG